jgi:hypothetical protein
MEYRGNMFCTITIALDALTAGKNSYSLHHCLCVLQAKPEDMVNHCLCVQQCCILLIKIRSILDHWTMQFILRTWCHVSHITQPTVEKFFYNQSTDRNIRSR